MEKSNQTIVIYQSRYGYTKRYAQWIAQELQCKAVSLSQISLDELKEYGTVIQGGALYAGKIAGAKWVMDNASRLSGKNLLFFVVGISSKEDTDMFHSYLDSNFTGALREQMKFFYFTGGMDYKRLSVPHRMMMAMMHRMLKKKSPLTESDKVILESYQKSIDLTDHNAILPLAEYVKTLSAL